MQNAGCRVVWMVGLLGASVVVSASETSPAVPIQADPVRVVPRVTSPQEPVGFLSGGVIGGLAAGPVGAVIGAGIGTWLGNRVHRAGEAAQAEARVASLRADASQLQTEKSALLAEKLDLSETNRALTARLDQLSHSVDAAQSARDDAAQVNETE